MHLTSHCRVYPFPPTSLFSPLLSPSCLFSSVYKRRLERARMDAAQRAEAEALEAEEERRREETRLARQRKEAAEKAGTCNR